MNDNQRAYEQARSKSVGQEKVVKYVKFKKDEYIKRLKATFLAGAIASMVLISGAVMFQNGIVENIKDNNVVESTISEYRQVVNDATHRTDNNQGYWYETNEIAQKLLEKPDDLDVGLFGVYTEIGYNDANRQKMTNEVVYNISQFQNSTYNNFDEYLIQNGFIDSKGNVDYKTYEENMRKRIVNEHEIKELQDQNIALKSK